MFYYKQVFHKEEKSNRLLMINYYYNTLIESPLTLGTPEITHIEYVLLINKKLKTVFLFLDTFKIGHKRYVKVTKCNKTTKRMAKHKYNVYVLGPTT